VAWVVESLLRRKQRAPDQRATMAPEQLAVELLLAEFGKVL